MKNINQQLLENVNGAYAFISSELSKPEEDVVSISLCGASKNAIAEVLKLYLDGKGAEYKTALSVNELINSCKKLDKNFENFDFKLMICRCDHISESTDAYCLDERNIDACFKLFNQLREYIFGSLNISLN